jgi:hypothetical protein
VIALAAATVVAAIAAVVAAANAAIAFGTRRRNVPGRVTGAITDVPRAVTRAVTIFIERALTGASGSHLRFSTLADFAGQWHPLLDGWHKPIVLPHDLLQSCVW